MSFTLRAAVLFAAAFFIVPTAGAHACAGADSSGGSARDRAAAVRCLVGEARAQSGRAPLHRAVSLARSARRKASKIDACGSFTHTPCGAPFEAQMRETGYAKGCYSVAENLAWVDTGATPRDVLDAWMHSPPHRDTLLSARFKDTGVARRVASLPDAGRVELWVQHFGKRC
jgi:uncharacterized protein YkwD